MGRRSLASALAICSLAFLAVVPTVASAAIVSQGPLEAYRAGYLEVGQGDETEVHEYTLDVVRWTHINLEFDVSVGAGSVSLIDPQGRVVGACSANQLAEYGVHARIEHVAPLDGRYTVQVRANWYWTPGGLYAYNGCNYYIRPWVIRPTHVIAYGCGPWGSIVPYGRFADVQAGASATFRFVPLPGYHVAGVELDGAQIGTPTSITFDDVRASHRFWVTFAPDIYTLTYAAGTGGTVVGATSQTVSHGGSGTLVTAVPAVGYSFVSWSDGSTNPARTDTAVVGNTAVTANFAVSNYTLTYTAGTGGTVVGATTQTVEHGGSGMLVTAVPAVGYRFVSWSDDATSPARTESAVVGNTAVTANFALCSYVITSSAGAHGSISPLGVSSVNHSDGITFTIEAESGFRIADVFIDGASVGASRTCTFRGVTADHTIVASFVADGVIVSVPMAPTSMSVNKSRSISGYLRPRHSVGSYPVRIYRYRLVKGKWEPHGYVKARVGDYRTYSKYTAALRLPYRGKWRLRAHVPASGAREAAWSSGYAYVTVK